MNLSYPFDSAELIKNKKKIKRELLNDNTVRIKKNIAFLGGSTTNDIVNMTELFLLSNGIEPSFYQSEYAMYWQEAMFENKELKEFKPDIIFIHTTLRNIEELPAMNDSEQRVEEMLEGAYKKFEAMWEHLKSEYGCTIIQNNFEYPFYRLLGNRDAWDIHGTVNFVNRLNDKFYAYARSNNGFYINDINYLSASMGLDNWCDLSFWYMYKYAMSMNGVVNLAFNLSNIIKSVFGKNKKTLVMDLDNTLWGGVVGDDGVENIEIGQEAADGQCFYDFQKYIKAHKQLGILLTVNSKNDEENALAGISHPDGALNKDDFTVIKANWENKDRNIIQTAAQLNLGADSFVFCDDNPVERDIVASSVEGIAVPKFDDPLNYIRTLDKNAYFEITAFSDDDLKRNEMYKANAQRQSLLYECADFGEYLKGLEMTAVIEGFIPMYYQRISHLANKSNQFNLTTKRYTVDEIQNVAEDKSYITLYGKLSDKFGDNGVVSLVIGRKDGKRLHIDLWLMSCRVLKRDMEFAMLDSLVQKCRENGIEEIIGYYYKTAKNSMVSELYKTFGFEKTEGFENGDSEWKLNIENYENKNKVIKVELK
ncbi:MAG: HAD-IIIC family phosphatase [Ruminococcaceae bacterium]|nr:HAD-IIIC family phosphatase [Oscillospiraceae bacterium]